MFGRTISPLRNRLSDGDIKRS